MALDWVQELLNAVSWVSSFSGDPQLAAQVTPDDAQVWQRVQMRIGRRSRWRPQRAVTVRAKLYRVEIASGREFGSS